MSNSKLDNLSEEYAELEIRDFTFKTDHRTISIENISTISIIQYDPYATIKFYIRIIGGVIAAYGCLAKSTLYGGGALNDLTTIIIGLIIVGLSIIPILKPYLVISTNDGVRTLFFNTDVSKLETIKKILDERIENKSSTGNYTINFNTGKIEKLSIAAVDKIETQIKAVAIEKIDQQVETLQPETIISQSSDTNIAIASTGIIQDTHNHSGNIKFDQQIIDYTNYLPVMEQWKDFMAQQKTDMTAQGQMEELIELMKSGTKGPMEKTRLQTLGQELSNYLRAYDGFSQLMGDIIKLVT
ncbi:MAG: hypothetical protein GY927_11865 [bacterium]|nr:hypothetical protein [bacterium]